MQESVVCSVCAKRKKIVICKGCHQRAINVFLAKVRELQTLLLSEKATKSLAMEMIKGEAPKDKPPHRTPHRRPKR